MQPDILFVGSSRKHIITKANIQGAPDLIIEILSFATVERARGKKKEIYQKFGVKDYWLVEPEERWIAVYALKDGAYALYQRAEKTGGVQSKTISGFTLQLAEVFKQSDFVR